METSFTVAEVAKMVADRSADTELLIRRIRHWTLSGALRPSGPIHGGTGRHRRYSRSAVYRATLLNRLADWGMPVAVLIAVGKDLEQQIRLIEFADSWNAATEGTEEICLILVLSAPADRAQDVAVTVSLKPVSEAAKWVEQGGEAIIVNLTALFAAIVA